MHPTVKLPGKQLEDFCRRWHIPSLALFGSALHEGSFSEGNLGILVTFDVAQPSFPFMPKDRGGLIKVRQQPQMEVQIW